MNRSYIIKNQTWVALLLFLTIYTTIQFAQPAFLYNDDGSIRQFGVGYRNKTIFPMWLMSMVLGILCYLFVVVFSS